MAQQFPGFPGNFSFNCTVNCTGFQFHFDEIIESTDKIIIGFFCSLILLTGVVGNSMVIYLFGWRERKTRSRSELMFLQLAVIDLLSSVMIPTLIAYRYIANVTSISLYKEICTSSETLSGLGTTLSETALILICFERYRGIIDPFRQGTKAILLVAGYIFGLVIAITVMAPFWAKADLFCTAGFLLSQVNFIVTEKTTLLLTNASLVIARDFISLFIMALLISRMVTALRKSEASVEANTKERSKKFRHARRMLMVVIICFTVCILPDGVVGFFLQLFLYNRYFETRFFTLRRVIHSTAYLKMLVAANSAINPIIYSLMHPLVISFRKDMKQMIIRYCCCCRFCKEEADRSKEKASKTISTQPAIISTSMDSKPESSQSA